MGKLPNRLDAAIDAAKKKLELRECADFLSEDERRYLYDHDGKICAVVEGNGYIDGINSRMAEFISNNKIRTYECLKAHNIKHPETYSLQDLSETGKFVASVNWARYFGNKVGYPLIAKPNQGSHSMGIKLIENYNDLVRYISEYSEFTEDLIIQQYIPGPEYKIVLFDCDIVVAYKKTSDDPIKPYSRGETEEIKYISPEMEEHLIQAASSLDLNYCSIDIKTPTLSKFDAENTYILELNCHPGIHFMLHEKGPHFVRELYKKLLMDVISKCKIVQS